MHFYSSNDRDKDNGKNNSIYCRYCSTSPKVEPPGFCDSMRATFRFWKFSRFIWSLIWQLGLIWTGLMMMAMMKSTPLCTGLMISCRRMISDPRPLQSLFAGNAVFIFILDFILFFVQTWSRRYLLNNHLFWGKFRIFTFVLFLRLLFLRVFWPTYNYQAREYSRDATTGQWTLDGGRCLFFFYGRRIIFSLHLWRLTPDKLRLTGHFLSWPF